MIQFNSRGKQSDAVSPVVGVMLMLVVTIIIAAVVSAFAGGLTSGEEEAPPINAEISIANGGTWGTSYYQIDIKGVKTPIATKNVKIINSWKASDGTNATIIITGPNSTPNSDYPVSTSKRILCQSPLGYGPGVNQSVAVTSMGPGGQYYPDQMYGNYSITGGTAIRAAPTNSYGITPSTKFQYTASSSVPWVFDTDRDGMQATLGRDWYKLRAGDIVKVRFVHIPSGKVILDKEVVVGGA